MSSIWPLCERQSKGRKGIEKKRRSIASIAHVHTQRQTLLEDAAPMNIIANVSSGSKLGKMSEWRQCQSTALFSPFGPFGATSTLFVCALSIAVDVLLLPLLLPLSAIVFRTVYTHNCYLFAFCTSGSTHHQNEPKKEGKKKERIRFALICLSGCFLSCFLLSLFSLQLVLFLPFLLMYPLAFKRERGLEKCSLKWRKGRQEEKEHIETETKN